MRHEVFGDRVATLAASVLFCRECVWVWIVMHFGHSRQKERNLCGIFCFTNSKPSKTQINRESSLWQRLSLCVPQTLLCTQTRSRTWGDVVVLQYRWHTHTQNKGSLLGHVVSLVADIGVNQVREM